jgi:hypothetical protein
MRTFLDVKTTLVVRPEDANAIVEMIEEAFGDDFRNIGNVSKTDDHCEIEIDFDEHVSHSRAEDVGMFYDDVVPYLLQAAWVEQECEGERDGWHIGTPEQVKTAWIERYLETIKEQAKDLIMLDPDALSRAQDMLLKGFVEAKTHDTLAGD